VTSVGRLVPGGEAEQRRLLVAEGVKVAGDRVRSAPAGRFSRPRAVRQKTYQTWRFERLAYLQQEQR